MINSKHNAQNVSAISNIIENYFIKGKEKDALPSHLVSELRSKYFEGYLFLEDLGRVYNHCQIELNRLYLNFKQTKSYLAIKKRLKQNDIVNNRLFKFRMISEGY